MKEKSKKNTMWFNEELSVYEQNGNKWYTDNKWATNSIGGHSDCPKYTDKSKDHEFQYV